VVAEILPASRPRKLLGTRRGRRLALNIASLVVLVSGSALVLLPVFWLVETAFKQPVLAYAVPPHFIFTPTLTNFRTVLTDQGGQYLSDLEHSLVLSGSSVALALLLGTPAGYAFARSRFRFSKVLSGWLICVYIIPALVYLVPLFVIYEKLDLTGSYPSLILYDETFELPFVVFMLRSYFADVSRELDDAARVDGCSRWLAFRKIILPVVVPGLSTVTILIAIGTWGEYFGALILTDSSTQTAPVALANYIGLDTSNWGALAAGALLLIVPVLGLVTFVQRGYMRQVRAGSTG
jgi:multiple sugar transport system permease protein